MFGREPAAEGLPAGAGWTLRPVEGFFVEPFAKLSYLTIHAKDYADGTGSLGVDKVYSLEAEAGATFGGEFTAAGAASRPYVVSGVNAFNKNVTATVGAGLRMGAGLSVDVAKNLTTNAALNYMRVRPVPSRAGRTEHKVRPARFSYVLYSGIRTDCGNFCDEKRLVSAQ